MSVEENTEHAFQHNILCALLAVTCLQQSQEGSQQERERMPECKSQNISSLAIQEKKHTVTTQSSNPVAKIVTVP